MSKDVLADAQHGFFISQFWAGEDRKEMFQLTIAPCEKPDGDLCDVDAFGAYTSLSRRRFRAMVRLLARMESRGLL